MGGPPLEFININLKMGGPPLGTISMDLAIPIDVQQLKWVQGKAQPDKLNEH